MDVSKRMRFMRLGLAWLAIVPCGLLAPSMGQEAVQTAYPPYLGERVVLVDVPNAEAYGGLSEAIARVEASSDERYYVVVIPSSGQGTRATSDYADELYARWSRGGQGFDPARSVLIVISLGNRQVAMRASDDLQMKYGLRGERIERTLIGPVFLPLAREGRLPAAARALVEATEKYIDERRDESDKQRLERARNAEQVKRDAADAVGTAARLLEEAQAELAEKRGQGLGVGGIAADVGRAAEALGTLKGRQETEPGVVLDQAKGLQHDLEEALGQLRDLPARKASALKRLDEITQQAQALEAAIEQARKDGEAVEPGAQALQAILGERDAMAARVVEDPIGADRKGLELAERLGALREEVAALPGIRRQREAKMAQMMRQLQAWDASLTRAGRSGVMITQPRQEYARVSEALGKLVSEPVSDEAATLRELTRIESDLNAQTRALEILRQRHVFFTRTVPVVLFTVFGTIVGVSVWALWLRKRRAGDTAERRIKQVRAQATEVMEGLDRLKERHREILIVDPDFQQPMQGETLKVYMQAQDDLKQLWDRWLGIMEQLEEAQAEVRKAKGFHVEPLEKAERMLKDPKLLAEIQAGGEAVKGTLDKLDRAHEEAASRLEEMEAADAGLSEPLGGLERSGLPVDPYEAERGAIRELKEKIRMRLAADPLGAQEAIEAARQRLRGLEARVGQIAERHARSLELMSEIEAAREAASQQRAGGLRLDEEGGNPDVPLATAREAHARALEALRAGDPDEAGRALDASHAAVSQARQAMEQVVAAKSRLEREIPEERAAYTGLRGRIDQAAGDLESLRGSHAASTWREVEHHVEKARELAEGIPVRLAEAAKLSDGETQRYGAGVAALEQAQRLRREAEALSSGVSQRKGELDRVKGDCEAGWRDLAEQGRLLGKLIEQNGGIVPAEGRENLSQIMMQQRELERLMGEPRADWLEIQRRLARIRESLAVAREGVERSLQAHQALRQRSAQLSARADRVVRLLQSEQKDRPPANLRYKEARRQLDVIDQALRSGTGDWESLLQLTNEVEGELKRSEELAKEDIRLANLAIEELESAERSVRAARGFSVLGASADTRAAESILGQAQQLLQQQDYEHAIQQATAAEHAAREAFRSAERVALARREQMEAERRRRAAEELARRNRQLPVPGGIPPEAWVIAGEALDGIMRGFPLGGGVTITTGGGSRGAGGKPRVGGGGGAGQGSWNDPGPASGQGSW
jgi:uncharacterized membrane protein YgcG